MILYYWNDFITSQKSQKLYGCNTQMANKYAKKFNVHMSLSSLYTGCLILYTNFFRLDYRIAY